MDEMAKVGRSLHPSEMQAALRNPTVSETLQQKKMMLEAQLAMVDEALAALERTPEVTQVLDLLAKVGVR